MAIGIHKQVGIYALIKLFTKKAANQFCLIGHSLSNPRPKGFILLYTLHISYIVMEYSITFSFPRQVCQRWKYSI